MEIFTKKDKSIKYETVVTNKEFYHISVKGDVVYLNVPPDAPKVEIKRALSYRFLDLYNKTHGIDSYVVHYRGRVYKLKCLQSKVDGVFFKDDRVTIKSIKGTRSQYRCIYVRMLKKTVEDDIACLMDELCRDFSEITVPKIIVREISGCLGLNCGTHIIISPNIARYDKKFVKVLLYHEVCHSLVRGHGQKFWDTLESKYPGGVQLNMEMREISCKLDVY